MQVQKPKVTGKVKSINRKSTDLENAMGDLGVDLKDKKVVRRNIECYVESVDFFY